MFDVLTVVEFLLNPSFESDSSVSETTTNDLNCLLWVSYQFFGQRRAPSMKKCWSKVDLEW